MTNPFTGYFTIKTVWGLTPLELVDCRRVAKSILQDNPTADIQGIADAVVFSYPGKDYTEERHKAEALEDLAREPFGYRAAHPNNGPVPQIVLDSVRRVLRNNVKWKQERGG
jgi:hypothetical protein